jgi:hypothetical protein
MEIDGLKIIRYESSIFYANVENFIYKLKKLSGVDPDDVIERINRRKRVFKRRASKSGPRKSVTVFFTIFLVYIFNSTILS